MLPLGNSLQSQGVMGWPSGPGSGAVGQSRPRGQAPASHPPVGLRPCVCGYTKVMVLVRPWGRRELCCGVMVPTWRAPSESSPGRAVPSGIVEQAGGGVCDAGAHQEDRLWSLQGWSQLWHMSHCRF